MNTTQDATDTNGSVRRITLTPHDFDALRKGTRVFIRCADSETVVSLTREDFGPAGIALLEAGAAITLDAPDPVRVTLNTLS